MALYGRKINNAEHQLTFIRYLRLIADDEIEPAAAVRAYHADLAKLGIRPYRTLDEDLIRTDGATSYGGTSSAPRPQGSPSGSAARAGFQPAAEPDFSKMTPAEKVQWNLDRWKRIIG